MAGKSDSQVVKDVGRWEWSEIWKKEDWWAIWLGLIILLAGVVVYFPHAGAMKEKLTEIDAKYAEQAKRTDKFKTVAWYQLSDEKKKVKAMDISLGKWLKKATATPHGWKSNPVDSFVMSKDAADAKNASGTPKYEAAKAAEKEALAVAQAAEAQAEEAGFSNAALNAEAKDAIAKGVSHTCRPATPRRRSGPSPTTRWDSSSAWACSSPFSSGSA